MSDPGVVGNLRQIVVIRYSEEGLKGKLLPIPITTLKNLVLNIEFPNEKKIKDQVVNEEDIFADQLGNKYIVENFHNDYYLANEAISLWESANAEEMQLLDVNKTEDDISDYDFIALVFDEDMYILKNKSTTILSTKMPVIKNFFLKSTGVYNENPDNVKKLEMLSTNGISLDLDKRNFLARIQLTYVEDEVVSSLIVVYDTYQFERTFSVQNAIIANMEKKIDMFSQRFFLTQSNIQVNFVDGVDAVKRVMKDEPGLKMATVVAKYTDNSRRKIKQISGENLKETFEELHSRIDSGKYALSKHDLPEPIFDSVGNFTSLNVSSETRQLEVFTALLSNKLIEKLLDGNIMTPFESLGARVPDSEKNHIIESNTGSRSQ